MRSSFYKYSTSGQENQFSGNTYSALLPATTAKTLTVPYVSGPGVTTEFPQLIAVITSGGTTVATHPVWVANNATAAIPAGDFSAANGELVTESYPLIKSVKTGDVLSFITTGSNVQIGVAFYLAI